MKEELKKLSYVPKNKKCLMMEIQKFWNRVDPRDYCHYTEQLTCKIEDVIEIRGLATIN